MSDLTELAIFLQAIEEENFDDRLAYLNSACGEDERLRASVDALLAAHEAPAALLDHPIGSDYTKPSPTLLGLREPLDHIGMQIGPYKLMEQIGEGGFGLVFVAEQAQPVRRRVALKIVKPGLGSKEVIARFEAEQQAVAIMNHPNIAQIFDAGVTADGRPYFAMELVRGLPITDFCNKQRQNIVERLHLMVDVCAAVHHAHQKGIIHRDLKPSNVMVTLHDGKPVAKVIDFGLAKALGEQLTDKTVYTCFFSMIGTPLYMSPEQAEMSGLDIDTRSDIFSLGVIMYELLVGETPFDRARLDSAGLDELRQIIREEEPPRPSMRLSTCNRSLATTADQRKLDPRSLASTLQGDLDWIVMKSLDKDRTRRYDSTAALAKDIRRYLHGEPIEARPPSTFYRLHKFARRHRVAFLTATLVGVTMIVGTTASLWQMSKAIGERDAKDKALLEATAAKAEAIGAKQKVEQFAEDQVRANELVVSAQVHAAAGRWADASGDYNAAVAIQPSYHLPRVQRAQLFTRLGLWDEAANDYAMAIESGAASSQPQWWGVAALYLYAGHDDVYRRISEQRREQILRDPTSPQWMLLRDLALSNQATSPVEFKKFVAIAEEWLYEPRFGREPPPPGPPPSNGDSWRRPPGGPPGGPIGRPPRRDRSGLAEQAESTPYYMRQYITAMLHLRSTDSDAAIDLLMDAAHAPRCPSKYLFYAPIALAHHRSGEHDQAIECLDESDAMLQELLSNLSQRPLQNAESPWIDLVEGLQVNREASHVVRGSPSSLASQLDQRRAATLKLLKGQQP